VSAAALKSPRSNIDSGGRQQIAVVVQGLRAELLHAPVVGVADERNPAVGLHVRRTNSHIALETLQRGGGTDSRTIRERGTRAKAFEHQTVVRGRLLEVDAVRR
jgi:hypothetical protein